MDLDPPVREDHLHTPPKLLVNVVLQEQGVQQHASPVDRILQAAFWSARRSCGWFRVALLQPPGAQ